MDDTDGETGCDRIWIRHGMASIPKALPKILRYGVERMIVYISCKADQPGKRSSRYLTGGRISGWSGCLLRGSMFPRTGHVETVVLLSQLKQKPDDYINVTIELDDMDITSAETKATYDEIKKYVAEHNAGMKVSNLYISQVKRKCGIEVERIIIYLKMKIAGNRSVQKIRECNCGGIEAL